MLLHIGLMATQQPDFNLSSGASSAEVSLRTFKTVLSGRVVISLTNCPVALSFNKSPGALYGRTEPCLHNSDGETVEQRDDLSFPRFFRKLEAKSGKKKVFLILHTSQMELSTYISCYHLLCNASVV